LTTPGGNHPKLLSTLFGTIQGYALLAAAPATGRTHQVRVHAYALAFPHPW